MLGLMPGSPQELYLVLRVLVCHPNA
uniref:(California timema) hypothetical protein n=1 Tax=Timema californicum TaxID=61474 RepID=A0A7R9PEL9_TIMCA|nr:unnamed protein product [Timema californicum]